MKQRFRSLAAALLLLALLFTTTAYGAEPSVSLECPEQAAPGTSFSAALVYEDGLFQSCEAEIAYDPEILEFRSCSGGEEYPEEEGLVRISLSGADGKVYLSCKLRFKALKEGESFITVTTSRLQDADGTELIAEARSAKVLVTETAAVEPEEEDEGALIEEPEKADEIYILWAAKTAVLRAADGFIHLISQFTVSEFVLFSLCGTVILLLLVLLAVEKRR